MLLFLADIKKVFAIYIVTIVSKSRSRETASSTIFRRVKLINFSLF